MPFVRRLALRRLSRASDGVTGTACAVAAVLVYAVSAWGQLTVYDYFGRLAVALSRGQYWLDDAPSHLNELVRGSGGHLYEVTPPLPALLLVPFVGLAAPAVLQQALSVVCGGLSAAPLYLALRGLEVPRPLALIVTLLGSFGTTLWVSAADGRSWYAADAVAVLLTSTALALAVRRAPAAAIGAVVGAAALARLPVILVAPGLLLIALRGMPADRAIRATAIFCAAVAPFAIVEGLYNIARWGTPLEVGYGILSHDDPLYAQGLFSLSYLPRHVYAMFFEPPGYADGDLFFLRARSVGMSLLITTPAMLWLARSAIVGRAPPHAGALALSCVALVPDVLFGTVGFEQYGYRRSLDIEPFLLALLAGGGGWSGAGWSPWGSTLFRCAVGASIAVTAYFLIEIRIFGFA